MIAGHCHTFVAVGRLQCEGDDSGHFATRCAAFVVAVAITKASCLAAGCCPPF